MRADRRRHARQPPGEAVRDLGARLRSGHDIAVMNVSGGGLLIETASRMLPGSRVEVVLPSPDGSAVAGGRVLRAWVAGVHGDDGVRYRAAIQFDRESSWGVTVPDE